MSGCESEYCADVRMIISDDESLQEGVLPALREYNLAQFIVADVPGTKHQVLCSMVCSPDQWLMILRIRF